jgi:phosphoglycerate dehydrogenase-like enzyme
VVAQVVWVAAASVAAALVVNVARGGHIVTEDLVAVLAAGGIGGAALDVTEPEPLPRDHPLWSEPRCIITPHSANTIAMAIPLLSERIRENVGRWLAGEVLVGPVDVDTGY